MGRRELWPRRGQSASGRHNLLKFDRILTAGIRTVMAEKDVPDNQELPGANSCLEVSRRQTSGERKISMIKPQGPNWRTAGSEIGIPELYKQCLTEEQSSAGVDWPKLKLHLLEGLITQPLFKPLPKLEKSSPKNEERLKMAQAIGFREAIQLADKFFSGTKREFGRIRSAAEQTAADYGSQVRARYTRLPTIRPKNREFPMPVGRSETHSLQARSPARATKPGGYPLPHRAK